MYSHSLTVTDTVDTLSLSTRTLIHVWDLSVLGMSRCMDHPEIFSDQMKHISIMDHVSTRVAVCYYVEKEGVLFSGDTLFCCSVGRSDFATSSTSALIRSISSTPTICLSFPITFPSSSLPRTINPASIVAGYRTSSGVKRNENRKICNRNYQYQLLHSY